MKEREKEVPGCWGYSGKEIKPNQHSSSWVERDSTLYRECGQGYPSPPAKPQKAEVKTTMGFRCFPCPYVLNCPGYDISHLTCPQEHTLLTRLSRSVLQMSLTLLSSSSTDGSWTFMKQRVRKGNYPQVNTHKKGTLSYIQIPGCQRGRTWLHFLWKTEHGLRKSQSSIYEPWFNFSIIIIIFK